MNKLSKKLHRNTNTNKSLKKSYNFIKKQSAGASSAVGPIYNGGDSSNGEFELTYDDLKDALNSATATGDRTNLTAIIVKMDSGEITVAELNEALKEIDTIELNSKTYNDVKNSKITALDGATEFKSGQTYTIKFEQTSVAAAEPEPESTAAPPSPTVVTAAPLGGTAAPEPTALAAPTGVAPAVTPTAPPAPIPPSPTATAAPAPKPPSDYNKQFESIYNAGFEWNSEGNYGYWAPKDHTSSTLAAAPSDDTTPSHKLNMEAAMINAIIEREENLAAAPAAAAGAPLTASSINKDMKVEDLLKYLEDKAKAKAAATSI